jgi:hypothetical protein
MEYYRADKFLDSPAVDLTGEGNPDILLGFYYGGSHCCRGMLLIDLGPEPVELLHIWATIQGNRGEGIFKDLDGDGVYELITADAIEAPCTTPTVKVILKYQPDHGFQPASPNFPEQYIEDVEAGIEFIGRDSDPENRCSIPMLAAAYYFSGRPEEARQIFNQYYTAADAENYWLELETGFKNARFYID